MAHLVGARARCEVEVLGLAAKHQVAHAAAHEVGRMAVPVEAANHFRGVRVDEPTRNRVSIDERLRRILTEGASIVVVRSTEVSIYNSGHRIPKPMKAKK
jgi:hypothetical protein